MTMQISGYPAQGAGQGSANCKSEGAREFAAALAQRLLTNPFQLIAPFSGDAKPTSTMERQSAAMAGPDQVPSKAGGPPQADQQLASMAGGPNGAQQARGPQRAQGGQQIGKAPGPGGPSPGDGMSRDSGMGASQGAGANPFTQILALLSIVVQALQSLLQHFSRMDFGGGR